MKFLKTLVLMLAVMTVAGSCIKEKLEESYNKQEEQIDKYIASALERTKATRSHITEELPDLPLLPETVLNYLRPDPFRSIMQDTLSTAA